jgi:predicted aspartyl protease
MPVRHTVAAGASIALAAVILAGCGGSTPTPAPTAAPTAAPATAAPTEAPTAAPTEAPSPSAVAEASPPVVDVLPRNLTTIASTTTLPVTFPFDKSANEIRVDATIGGQPGGLMMLDTGAPLNISKSLADAIGGPVIARTPVSAADGTQILTDVVDAGTVTIGGLTVEGNQAITPFVGPESPLSCIAENGLVGANTMSGAIWQINYQDQTVTVASSLDQLDNVDGAIALPIFPQPGISGTPIVGIPVGNSIVGFIVDTGNAGDMLLTAAEAARVGITVPADAPLLQQVAAGAAGRFANDTPYVTTPIKLASGEPTPIAEGDKTADYPLGISPSLQLSNIGNAFLANFIPTFDFPGNTLYLSPLAEDGSLEKPVIAGATVTWDGTDILVTSVPKGSANDKAGLEVGATVTAINGNPVAGHDDYCGAITSGDPITEITTEDGKTWDTTTAKDFFAKP